MKMYFISFPNIQVEYRVHKEECLKLADFLSREFLVLSILHGAAIKKHKSYIHISNLVPIMLKGLYMQRIINGEFFN